MPRGRADGLADAHSLSHRADEISPTARLAAGHVRIPTPHRYYSCHVPPSHTIMLPSILHSSEVSHAEKTHRTRTLAEGV